MYLFVYEMGVCVGLNWRARGIKLKFCSILAPFDFTKQKPKLAGVSILRMALGLDAEFERILLEETE